MNLKVDRMTEDYPVQTLAAIWSEGAQKPEEYSQRRINWAFLTDPFGKARVYLLKDEDKEKYIGCSALLPRSFIFRGEKLKAALIADTAISKEYRSLGPALFLHKEILKDSTDLSFILAFPNKIAEAVIQRMGFQKARNLVHYMKIVKCKTLLKKKVKVPLLSRLLLIFAPIIDLAGGILDFRLPVGKKFISVLEDAPMGQIDALWGSFKSRYDFVLERNSNYFEWRYSQNPNLNKNYKFFSVRSRTESNPIAVISYFSDNGSACVDDFMWIEDHIKLQRLIFLFARSMRRVKMKAIRFAFMENCKLERAFRRNLFWKIGESSLLYYILDKSKAKIMEELLTSDRTFITSGDRDF